MKRLFKLLLLLLAIAAIGVVWLIYQAAHPANHYSEEQVHPFLNAQEWTLYSLDPNPLSNEFGETFHGHAILGRHEFHDTKPLQQVVLELHDTAKNWNGGLVKCFLPRHGIRVTQDGKKHDMLICYECSQVQLNIGSEEVGIMYLATNSKQEPTPTILNDLLTKAGIKLPEQRQPVSP